MFANSQIQFYKLNFLYFKESCILFINISICTFNYSLNSLGKSQKFTVIFRKIN